MKSSELIDIISMYQKQSEVAQLKEEMNSAPAGLDMLAGLFDQARLLEHRSIFISEGVNAAVAKRVVSNLLTLDAMGTGVIKIYVNSPGGEVNSGFSIYDTMRFIKSEVKVINTGLCASIATVINVGAKKGNRLSMPNSRFLIHQPLIMGQIYGQASDLEIHANEIIKTRSKINHLLSKECGQPLAKVEKDTVRDYWMDAEAALEYGLIDKIVTSAKEL
ncbi:MAG: ATP-dependent Clp protease proteolytic subunit [Oligoflexales bacterium]|nr:ATP-dependent Clp protease proteolytic subunit [Oligoflexales bacterium]